MHREYSNLMRLFAAILLMAVASFAQAIAPNTGIYQEPQLSPLHQDLTGNTIAATDVNGNLLYTEQYRPYGERLTNNAASQALQPLGNRIWFHGKVQDEATGLQYFNARFYDPVIGSFTQSDPVGFDEGNMHSFNRYAYGNNNPYRDRDGNSPPSRVFAPSVASSYVPLTGRTASFAMNLATRRCPSSSVYSIAAPSCGCECRSRAGDVDQRIKREARDVAAQQVADARLRQAAQAGRVLLCSAVGRDHCLDLVDQDRAGLRAGCGGWRVVCSGALGRCHPDLMPVSVCFRVSTRG